MSFIPHQVYTAQEKRSRSLDQYQRRALLGMVGMVLLTFLASNMWAILWQGSDWLVATVLPAVVVDLTNEEREGSAAPTLRRSEVLDDAAQRKAEHMAAEGYFAHYSPDGVTPWHWFDEVSYEFVHAGENLAVHFNDSRALVRAWMDSPTHRENIVNQQFTEIGVGTARGRYQGFDTTFVVQLFGTPAAPVAGTQVSTESDAGTLSASEPARAADSDAATTTPSNQTVTVAGETSPESAPAPARSAEPSENEVVADAPDTTASSSAASDTTATETADSVVSATGRDASDATSEEASVATATDEATQQPYDAFSVATAGGTRPTTVWQTGVHTTSTNRTVATSAVATASGDGQIGILGYATQPQYLMQGMYIVLSFGVFLMLLWAIRLELRRQQFIQVSYSVGLLLLMVGFWYVHLAVTSSVIIS